MNSPRSTRLHASMFLTLLAFTLAMALPASAQAPTDTTGAVPVVTAADSALRAVPLTPADSIAQAAPTRATWTAQDDARAGQASATPTSLLRGGPLGELVSIYSPRNLAEIQRQMDNASAQQRMAQGEIDESRRNAEAADGQVRIMSEELQTTKTRRDVAKKAKNLTDTATLTADAKRQDTEKSYLERLRDALRADADRLEKERDAATARARSLQLEADVASKHAQLTAAGAAVSPAEVTNYRNQLKQMLAAQKTAADKGIDAASARKEVADRQLKQLEALSKIGR